MARARYDALKGRVIPKGTQSAPAHKAWVTIREWEAAAQRGEWTHRWSVQFRLGCEMFTEAQRAVHLVAEFDGRRAAQLGCRSGALHLGVRSNEQADFVREAALGDTAQRVGVSPAVVQCGINSQLPAGDPAIAQSLDTYTEANPASSSGVHIENHSMPSEASQSGVLIKTRAGLAACL